MALIATVSVDPPSSWEGVTRRLDSLPPPGRYAGIIVRCDDRAALDELILWCDAHRREIPFAIGVVAAREVKLLRDLAQAPFRPRPLIMRSELPMGRLRPEHMQELTEQGTWSLISNAVATMFGLPPRRALVKALVINGLAGRGVDALARATAISRTCLYEEFERQAIPPPGELLRIIRHAGVLIGVDLGTEVPVAVRLAGWMSPASYRSARRRLIGSPAWDRVEQLADRALGSRDES